MFRPSLVVTVGEPVVEAAVKVEEIMTTPEPPLPQVLASE
jgi:hypothetical protein